MGGDRVSGEGGAVAPGGPALGGAAKAGFGAGGSSPGAVVVASGRMRAGATAPTPTALRDVMVAAVFFLFLSPREQRLRSARSLRMWRIPVATRWSCAARFAALAKSVTGGELDGG